MLPTALPKQDFMRLHNFTIVQCNYFQAIPLLEDHTFTCWSLISRIFFIHIPGYLASPQKYFKPLLFPTSQGL